jgi:hypothetical protein
MTFFSSRFARTLRWAAILCAVVPSSGTSEDEAPVTAAPRVAAKRPAEPIKTRRRPIAQTTWSLLPAGAEAEPEVIREYEIRLEAHRRELLDREAELEATKRALAELQRKSAVRVERPTAPVEDVRWHELERSEHAARAEASELRVKTETLESQLRTLHAATASAVPPPPADDEKALVATLQRELDVERANRATLEAEIHRLVSQSRSADQFAALNQSLDGARAEILTLNQRLAAEQRARESLEVSIERVRRAAGIDASGDWMERFETTVKERREQAERLQEELHRANEMIIVLKSKLEAADDATHTADVQGLEGQIKQLRDALQSAQQANADLRTQAELASRLAELLYGQSR